MKRDKLLPVILGGIAIVAGLVLWRAALRHAARGREAPVPLVVSSNAMRTVVAKPLEASATASGAVSSAAGQQADSRERNGETPPKAGASGAEVAAAPGPVLAGTAPLGMFKQSLGLSDEQSAELGRVLKKQQDKLATLRRDNSLSRQERRARYLALQQTFEATLNHVLTPEQAARWRSMRTFDTARADSAGPGAGALPAIGSQESQAPRTDLPRFGQPTNRLRAPAEAGQNHQAP